MTRPESTFRARLIHALETEPHLSVRDVADTVERLLAEQMPAPADGEGAGCGRPPQGHTALRARFAEALRKAAYVCPGDSCTLSEDECGENQPIVLAAAAVIDGIPEATLIDGEVYAIADAVVPVVEEALAEKDAEIRRLGEAVDADGGRIHRLRVDLTEQSQRAEQAEELLQIANDTANKSERARQTAETERATLADRYRDLDAQLTRERQQRLAAEAAIARVRRLQELTIAASCRVEAINQARDTLAALDADQPKETDRG